MTSASVDGDTVDPPSAWQLANRRRIPSNYFQFVLLLFFCFVFFCFVFVVSARIGFVWSSKKKIWVGNYPPLSVELPAMNLGSTQEGPPFPWLPQETL